MEGTLNKCFRESFEKWYFEKHCKSNVNYEDLMPHQYFEIFNWFNNLNFSFKYGIYQDFFDEKEIRIEIQIITEPTMQGGFFKSFKPVINFKGRFINCGMRTNERFLARKLAIEKAVDLYIKN